MSSISAITTLPRGHSSMRPVAGSSHASNPSTPAQSGEANSLSLVAATSFPTASAFCRTRLRYSRHESDAVRGHGGANYRPTPERCCAFCRTTSTPRAEKSPISTADARPSNCSFAGSSNPRICPLHRHFRERSARPDRHRAHRIPAVAPGSGRHRRLSRPHCFTRLIRANPHHRRPIDRLLKPLPIFQDSTTDEPQYMIIMNRTVVARPGHPRLRCAASC